MNIAQDTEAIPCPSCSGTGRVPFVDRSIANGCPSPCPTCRGSKRVLHCVGQSPTPPSPTYYGQEPSPPKLRLAT